MAIEPKRVLLIPLSCTILAKTGNAVILMDIPIKSAYDKNEIPSGAVVWKIT
jgi:hypothetical protein